VPATGVTYNVTIEIEGGKRPARVAEVIGHHIAEFLSRSGRAAA
jgi:hypothetical protein